MTVYIVILHYQNIKDTLACLKSVRKLDRNGLEVKVIIVSNKPGESLRDVPSGTSLRNTQGMSKIISNPKNLGFAAGVNAGIREALNNEKTEYILILNNDTILPPDLLTVLLKKQIDIAAPVVKFKSLQGNWVYDYGGKINRKTGRTEHIEKMSNVKCLSQRLISHWLKMSNEKEIDYVSGCCMLVRREVFEKIGLFDESYFFYFEDADFCTRAKKAGFKVEVNPSVCIYHKLGASIGRWTNRAILYNILGNFIFITKHLALYRPVGYLYLLILSGKIFMNKLRGK